MKLGSCILINVIAASIFGCATDHSPSDLKFEPAPPTESQALPMSTKYHTKADVLSGLGTPKSKVVLVPSGSSQCVER